MNPLDRKPANFKDLLVWQNGMEIAKLTYELTRTFPNEERFGTIPQMRRAAASIPSNLAEGQARFTTAQFIQFISHAEGSLAELETQVRLSISLEFCPDSAAQRLMERLETERKMLNGLRRKLWGQS